MGPKVVDHDARRAEIIAQVIPLFYSRGYEAVGIRDIAEAIGVSKSLLYHYFRTKEELFLAVCHSLMDADFSLLAKLVEGGTTAERVRTLFSFCAAEEATFRQQMVLLLEYARVAPKEERITLMREATEAYIAAFQSALGLERQQATQLYNAINGLFINRALTEGTPDIGEAAHFWAQILSAEDSSKGRSRP